MLPCGLLALGTAPGQPARICFFLPSRWTLLKLSTQRVWLPEKGRLCFRPCETTDPSDEPCISHPFSNWINEPCFQLVTWPTCFSVSMQDLLQFLPLQIMLFVFPLLKVDFLPHPSFHPFHLSQSESWTSYPLWPSSNDNSSTVSSHLPWLNTSSFLGYLGCCFHHSGVTWMPCRYLAMSLSPTR